MESSPDIPTPKEGEKSLQNQLMGADRDYRDAVIAGNREGAEKLTKKRQEILSEMDSLSQDGKRLKSSKEAVSPKGKKASGVMESADSEAFEAF